MKVKKSSLLFFAFALVIFWPDYFFFKGLNYLENILAAYAIIFVYNNRKRLSIFSYITLLYFVYFLLDTMFHGGCDIHTLISNIKIMLFVQVADIEIEKNDYDTISIMWMFVFAFCVINFISLIAFPNGLYQVETVWNEWGTKTSSRYWVFGFKNSHAFWCLLLELLSALKWYLRPSNTNKILAYICACVAVITQLLVGSSTATVACTIGAIAIFCVVFLKPKQDRNVLINSYWIVVLNYLIDTLLVFGMVTFLGPIIQNVFGKDLTFSNRTNAWMAAFMGFLKNPVFGTGILSANAAKQYLGSLSYMQAHNEWLQCLWQGGIVLFVIVVGMFFSIAKQNTSIKERNLKVMSDLFLVSVFVEMAFEVWLGSQLTWIMLLLMYKINSIGRTNICTIE